jgi:Nucleotidyl transferase AbiEii toxin, Type IV TA system
MTRQPGPYRTPEALRAAVTARARTAAKASPRFTVGELLRQFAYSRLLARIFTTDPEGWVLKGGIGLLARVPAVRHTLDLDLWSHEASLREAELALERASALDLGDHVRFEVGPWEERSVNPERTLAQAAVTCRIGRPEFTTFGVDLVDGPFPPLRPEPAPSLRPIDVPGLVEVPLRLYPIAGTVADKLSGIHTSYGGRLSSRYRDLVDLATIALTQRLVAREVHLALHEELRTQGLAAPAEFTVPHREAWAIGYAKNAQGLPHLRGVGFDEAFALVKAMIDPILAGRRDGIWRPETRRWEPGVDGGGQDPRGVGTAS